MLLERLVRIKYTSSLFLLPKQEILEFRKNPKLVILTEIKIRKGLDWETNCIEYGQPQFFLRGSFPV